MSAQHRHTTETRLPPGGTRGRPDSELNCSGNKHKNNNNIDFYIAHIPEIQINALYNKDMHTNKRKNYIKHTCNIILNIKSIVGFSYIIFLDTLIEDIRLVCLGGILAHTVLP